MMKKSKYLCLALLQARAFVVSSYSQTKAEAYPEMFTDDAGATILIMPPINHTNNVEAKEYFYYTLNTELASSGWYVYPPVLSLRTLQEESANDSELFISEPNLSKFRELFGADYLLFTEIDKWTKSATIKTIQVSAKYALRSTKTGNTVFSHATTYTYSLAETNAKIVSGASNLSTNTGFATLDLITSIISLGTMVTSSVATTAAVAKTGTMDVARYCNLYALKDIPYGPLHGLQGSDADSEANGYSLSFSNE